MEFTFPTNRISSTDFYFGQDFSKGKEGGSDRKYHNMLMSAPKLNNKATSPNPFTASTKQEESFQKLNSSSSEKNNASFGQAEPKPPSLLGSGLTTITFEAPSKVRFIRGTPTDLLTPEDDESTRHTPNSQQLDKKHNINNSFIESQSPSKMSQDQPVQSQRSQRSVTPPQRSVTPPSKGKNLHVRTASVINNSVRSKEVSPNSIASHSIRLDRSGNVSTLNQSQNQSQSQNSPQKYKGSTAQYYHEATEKIIEEAAQKEKIFGPKSLGGSPVKSARSTINSASPIRQILGSPSKTRNPKMKTLTNSKLVGNSQAEYGAKHGIMTVRITLDEALAEKDMLVKCVNNLKRAIEDSRLELEKTRENNKHLGLYMECLGKKNDHLDQNTTGLQALVNKTREEANQLQAELDFLNDKMKKMAKQTEFETERTQYLGEATRVMKLSLLEETELRNNARTSWKASHLELKRTKDLYNEASNFHKTMLETLEDGFKKYAKDG